MLSNFTDSKEDALPFYVHALSPNGARLFPRFSWEGTIGEVKQRIRQHFTDLAIIPCSQDQKLYSIYSLLHAFAPSYDIKHISPNLAGEFLLSVLNGKEYPKNLLSILLGTLFDEKGVSHKKISLLKACMNRSFDGFKIPPSLDLVYENIGYSLGRLLAIIEWSEKKQIVASRFYKTASILPKKIFPYLLNRCVDFTSSLPRIYFEYVHSFTEFPEKLDLTDQARFAIGYYQQRQQILLENNKDNNI